MVSGLRIERRIFPFLQRGAEGLIVLSLGILALVRLKAHVVGWGRDLASHIPSKLPPAERILAIEAAVPSATYFVTTVLFVGTTLAAALAIRALRGFRIGSHVVGSAGLPLAVAAVVGAHRVTPFWGWATAFLLAALTPIFSRAPRTEREPASANLHGALVLGAEVGCAFLTIALTFETGAPLYVPAFALGFGAGALFGASRAALADELSRAALPVLLLPLLGLHRAPTLKSTLGVLLLSAFAFAAARRWKVVGDEMGRGRDRWGVDLAFVATTFAFILPFRFRELPNADISGHEGQHLGWINSIVHGRWMMADAGFIYGPLREYALAFIAWLYGGLTLEHVRLAQVTVNLVGVLLVVAAARRACRGSAAITALATVLLLGHSAIVALVNYTNTIGFGWVDETRAGLAVFAVVIALANDRRSRWRLRGAGVLGGLAALYSHDFGILAIIGTLVGLVFSLLEPASSQRSRFREGALRIGDYLAGVAVPIGLFVLIYAGGGRLSALMMGARWAVRVGAGLLQQSIEPYPIDTEVLIDKTSLLTVGGDHLGISKLDYLAILAIPLVALAAALASAIQGRWTKRTSFVVGLAVFVALTMRHPLISADGWHAANASGPCVILVAAMIADARRLRLPNGPRLGAWPAALLAAAWMLVGSAEPLSARMVRLASGDERPSTGDRYAYDDIPRAGDLFVDGDHQALARYTLTHTQPSDRVFSSTWLLGGGTEAFLGNRRNAVPFDVPIECATEAQRAEALTALQANPPALIIGSYTNEFGPEIAQWIAEHYTMTAVPGASAPVYLPRQ